MVKLFVVKQLFQTSELNVHSGEWITITGKNGTGKTTLLESMMQLIKYEGTMAYKNTILKKIKDDQAYVSRLSKP